MVDLKPCPFCGSTELFVDPDEVGSGGQPVPPIHVGCCNCQAEQRADDVDDAKAAWNRRSPLPESGETYPVRMSLALAEELEIIISGQCRLLAIASESDAYRRMCDRRRYLRDQIQAARGIS